MTNKPTAFSSAVLVPQASLPQVTVPLASSVEIPVAGAPLPPTTRPTYKPNSPFKPTAAFQSPTTADIARRNVQLAPPPLPSLTPLADNPVPPAPGTQSPSRALDGYRYVAASGNDADDGSKEKPWQTIQRAVEWAQPGAVIIVQPGTYEPFHTVRSGAAGLPITFHAAGAAIIGPPGGVQPVERRAHNQQELYRLNNIHVQQSDYIVIDGFQVQHAGRSGICVLESRGVVLTNNVISAAGVFGILTGFAVEIQILNNQVFGTREQHGIYVSNSRDPHDRPVIRGNETYANTGNGIQLNGDCQMGGDGIINEALIENNVVHDNGMKGLSLISLNDSIVQNNLIYNNGKAGGAGGIHLADEEDCKLPSRGNVVVNNTVVEPAIAGIRLTDGAADNIIFNNLVISQNPLMDEAGGNKIDKVSNVCLFSSAGVFIDLAHTNFHTLATSPAKGLGLGRYFQQGAPLTDRDGHRRNISAGFDVGAY